STGTRDSDSDVRELRGKLDDQSSAARCAAVARHNTDTRAGSTGRHARAAGRARYLPRAQREMYAAAKEMATSSQRSSQCAIIT
ncbi:MAG: hypothetical protein ACRDIB_07910, partial [Ardenticatenaceae bacterium]